MTIKSRKPMFERLKQGLEEGIAHSSGELTLKNIEVPDDPRRSTLQHWPHCEIKWRCLSVYLPNC